MTTNSKPRRTADLAAETSTEPPVAPEASRTKQSQVLDLLREAGGVPLAAIVAATGWPSHTVRAALTGLRKKGHAIERSKIEGETRYAINVVAKR